MYDIKDEDIDIVTDLSQFSTPTQQSPLQMQLPVLELLKVCVLLFCLFVSWHYRLNFKAAVAWKRISVLYEKECVDYMLE